MRKSKDKAALVKTPVAGKTNWAGANLGAPALWRGACNQFSMITTAVAMVAI